MDEHRAQTEVSEHAAQIEGAETSSSTGAQGRRGASGHGEGHASATKPDRAVQAGYPPDSGPEQHVMTVREAMWRSAPMRFGLLIVLVLGSLVGGIWLALEGQRFWMWTVAVVGVIALALLLAWKVRTMTRALKISYKRTVYKRGLFDTSTSEVMHDNIRNVRVNQELWERIWNVGTIGISSAGSDGIEIEMRRVPSPGKVREIIDLYRPLG